MTPIYRNTYYSIDADSMEYSIVLAGTAPGTEDKEIFRGRAYRMPGEDYLMINISGICENYVGYDLDYALFRDMNGTQTRDLYGYCPTFYLKDVDGNILETYQFAYDWSYAILEYPAFHYMDTASSINGHYSASGYGRCIHSTAEDDYLHIEVDDDPSTDYDTPVCGAPGQFVYIGCNGIPRTFLIEGTIKRNRNFTSYDYSSAKVGAPVEFFDLTSNYSPTKHRYMTETNISYTITTGWLSDEESRLLVADLFNSPSIWLQTFGKGYYNSEPVLITDTKVEEKTYQTSGKKLNNYTITATVANTEIRR